MSAAAHTTPALDAPGSYLLVIRTVAPRALPIGRLGVCAFPPGWHVYAGSARRGLGARLRHHLAPTRPARWHVDILRRAGRVAAVWVVAGSEPAECTLAQALAALPGARRTPAFGSSDCRCPGHLVSFARRPALQGLWPGLVPLPGRALRALAAADASRTPRYSP